MVLKKRFLLSIAVVSLCLTACGGGGGSSPSPQTSTTPIPQEESKETETTSVSQTPVTEPKETTTSPLIESSETVKPNEQPSPLPVTPTKPKEIPATGVPITHAERVSNTHCLPVTPVVTPGIVGTVKAFPSLPSVERVTSMSQPPLDPSVWFVLTKEGVVYTFENDAAANQLVTSLNISNKIHKFGENGAVSIATHPNYPSDPRVFIMYSDSSNENYTTLSAFTANTQTHALDPRSEETLIVVQAYQPEHVGGDITFGTDGLLYASFGDDGWGTEQNTPSQNNKNLAGSIIRIDVSTHPYTIPENNPFSGNPLCRNGANRASQNCPEIFAYGLRNPWRISIDTATNTLWLGDVGQTAFEEINRVTLNQNYGWPAVEGRACTGAVANCTASDFAAPVVSYAWDGAAAVIGGYVYRGSQSPTLFGQYIFADYQKQSIYMIDSAASNVSTIRPIFQSPGQIATFAQDANGEVYAINYGATSTGDLVHRIIDSGGVNIDMPNQLSDTGCFNVASKTSAAGVFDYESNAELWSDGAKKKRAFAIPDGTTISVADDGDFIFPVGSILIKHFLHDDDYLETRLFIRYENGIGWRGYSYEWDDNQKDAYLLGDTERKTRNVTDFVHQFPSRNDCSACHSGAANGSLGLELAQQNKNSDTLNANLIDYLSAAGYFATPQSATASPTLYALDDEAATVEQRVRSYLHSNCSGCHRPGSSFSAFDLRFSTPLTETNLCNVKPTAGDLGLINAQRIAPGAAHRSVLLARMQSTNDDRMPPLGTLMEHLQATTLIKTWINALSGCP